MLKTRSSRFASVALLETLEDRRLLSGETWGAQEKLIGQDVAASNYPTLTGAGTSIVIIDTGVDYNAPDLGGGFGPGHKVIAGWDYVDNDADPMDTDGHGTGVAALAAGLPYVFNGATFQGVAPGANIIALRIDDGTFGWAKEAPRAAEALQWVHDHLAQYNIVAVNMSFGRGHYTSETDVGDLKDQIAQLAADGVFMAASSGNDGLQNGVPGIEYPGADPHVYSVGAVYPDGTLWSSTERSADMDLLAPGANITLAYYNQNKQFVHLSGGYGTSFSTAFVSGMAAVMKQLDPTMTPAEMMSVMKRSGTPLYDPTTGLTWPKLNVGAALGMEYAERDDAREQNDSMATATTLAFSGDTTSAGGLRLLAGDADYFKFTLGAQSDVDLSLSLSDTGATAPSMDLIDAQGTLVKHLSATDHIRLLAGTYYVRVNAPSATLVGTYGLTIDKTSDDALGNQTPQTATPIALDAAGHGELGGMTLLGGADDYYSFTIDGTRDVNLSIDYTGSSAAPAAQLLDTNGNFVATIGAALSRRLSAGRYLVRVSSATTLDGTYGVTIDSTLFVVPGANGLSNGIAYDTTGALDLAYFDQASNDLKFARRDANGAWGSVTVVDAAPGAGQYVSLALDANQRPGIAYYDVTNADLKYAHFNGSTWDVTTVDARFTTGYYPSLRYDAGNHPVISYYYKTGGDLRLATFDGAAWNLATVDSGGDVGRYSSLAPNPQTGRWSIAYENDSNPAFKYAEQGKSGWAITTVDATTRIAGGYISLAFNPVTKLPAFGYYDAYNANLKFASYNGRVWSNQVVASKGTVGLYGALAFDSSGNGDILYYNKGADTTMRARFASGVWNLTEIASDGGRWLTRAISTTGRQTFSYVRIDGLGIADL